MAGGPHAGQHHSHLLGCQMGRGLEAPDQWERVAGMQQEKSQLILGLMMKLADIFQAGP